MSVNASGQGSSRRVPALELVIVFSIVGLVAAIGLPAFAARAKGTALKQQVREQLVLEGAGGLTACELCESLQDAAGMCVARPYTNPGAGVVRWSAARGRNCATELLPSGS